MPDNAPYTHIFVAYASEDQKAADTFLSHLKLLKKKHRVTISTNKGLQKADIALLLISVDFMISDAYEDIEQQLQTQPTTEIIPVLIREGEKNNLRGFYPFYHLLREGDGRESRLASIID